MPHSYFGPFDHFEKNIIQLLDEADASGASLDLKTDSWRWWCQHQNIGIWVKCGGLAPNLKIELEGSPTDEETDYAILESASPVLTVSDTDPHILNMTAIAMPRLRLRITDNPGNGGDSTISIKIFQPFAVRP